MLGSLLKALGTQTTFIVLSQVDQRFQGYHYRIAPALPRMTVELCLATRTGFEVWHMPGALTARFLKGTIATSRPTAIAAFQMVSAGENPSAVLNDIVHALAQWRRIRRIVFI